MNIASEAWSKSKLLVKGLIIGMMVLLLMIPAYYVQQLVKEREGRQKEAIAEVSNKWAGRQVLTGPVLVVPYYNAVPGVNGAVTQERRFAYFLPETLRINAVMEPQEKHRGIYKVMLYGARTQMTGSFRAPDLAALQLTPERMLWAEAFIRMKISDFKGLNEELQMQWKDTVLRFSPDTQSDSYKGNGLTAPLRLTGPSDIDGVTFSAKINFGGSEGLQFTPVGRQTTINLQSSWPHPSFSGNGLPQVSNIKLSGFNATWNSLSHKRSFPQQFLEAPTGGGERFHLSANAVGVDLFQPVDTYQQTLRSVKYAVLCILLTFTAFFLIELVNKRSVHPFQYGLIGLALILFYTLLLSLAEYIGFNPAYAIATACTIALIAWFVQGILQSGRLSVLLSVVLVLMYGYIFTILQLQDFALLMGSIGLFITLAVIMYFSRKMQW
jgi:inner membrane protein